MPEELAAALRRLKTGGSPGFGFIFPGVYAQLPACANSKFQRSGEEH